MALGEWCSMAEREGEREERRGVGGEGEVVCVARRWAFKTRAVSGARLSLPPTQLTLLAWAGIAYQGYVNSPCLALLALAPALDGPVHGVESAAGSGVQALVCGLSGANFRAGLWRKEGAWAASCCSGAAWGAGTAPAYSHGGARKWHVRFCIFTPFKGR
jgi:hypothetical protein